MELRCVLSGFLLLLTPSLTDAEAVFVCPPPRPGASNSSLAPCGGGTKDGGIVVELDPGPLSIKWSDTARLKGSSYRVTLRSWDSDTVFCVLVDRIPSSNCVSTVKPKTETDNSTFSNQTAKPSNKVNNSTEGLGSDDSFSNDTDLSIGGISGSTPASNSSGIEVQNEPEFRCPTEFFLTVNIPKVTCDNCYLQITTISPNGSDCMVNLDSVESQCPLYYSCTNIRIRGGEDQQTQTLGRCGSQFLTHKEDWPYKPRVVTRKFVLDFQDHRDVFSLSFGTFQYTPLRGNSGMVTYDIQLWVDITVALNDLTVAWPINRRRWATFRTLQITGQHGIYRGRMRVFSQPNLQLLDDKWHVRIDHLTNATEEAEKIYIPLVRSAEVYSDLSANYTEKGWLAGSQFDDESAPLYSMVKPAGDCPPKPPTTTTQSTTTDALQTKPIPTDPVKKDRIEERMKKTYSFFTKAGTGRTVSSAWLVVLVLFCLSL